MKDTVLAVYDIDRVLSIVAGSRYVNHGRKLGDEGWEGHAPVFLVGRAAVEDSEFVAPLVRVIEVGALALHVNWQDSAFGPVAFLLAVVDIVSRGTAGNFDMGAGREEVLHRTESMQSLKTNNPCKCSIPVWGATSRP